MNELATIPDEAIMSRIYLVRGQKIMIDRDLAELYGVETKRLKEAVRRNIDRFPADFMFQMNDAEFEAWRRQFLATAEDRKGLRYNPFCFTEQGVTMLSCVLSGERAVAVNIRIIRIFTRLREMLMTHKDILLKLDQLERQVTENSADIRAVFSALKQLLTPPKTPVRKIGYK